MSMKMLLTTANERVPVLLFSLVFAVLSLQRWNTRTKGLRAIKWENNPFFLIDIFHCADREMSVLAQKQKCSDAEACNIYTGRQYRFTCGWIAAMRESERLTLFCPLYHASYFTVWNAEVWISIIYLCYCRMFLLKAADGFTCLHRYSMFYQLMSSFTVTDERE